MTLLLAVGLAGGLGALARFLLDGAVSTTVAGEFPAGTFAVNVSGTLVLGVLVGASLDGDALAIAATGVLASYTTFSTWMLEAQRLGEDGEFGVMALNLALSLAAGIVAVWAGGELGGLL
jgi:CrcB protein